MKRSTLQEHLVMVAEMNEVAYSIHNTPCKLCTHPSYQYADVHVKSYTDIPQVLYA